MTTLWSYNGFTVEIIDRPKLTRGGVTVRVRVVGSPELLWDREFNAVKSDLRPIA